jgi:hypothetical protein
VWIVIAVVERRWLYLVAFAVSAIGLFTSRFVVFTGFALLAVAVGVDIAKGIAIARAESRDRRGVS